jgi:hypothetical protein
VLVAGKLYPYEFSIVPSASQTSDGTFILGPYRIFGPSELREISTISGKTAISFDYFFDDKSLQPMKETLTTTTNKKELDITKSKYNFDEGDDAYKLDRRLKGSVITGVYENGTKKVSSMGDYLVFLKKETNNNFGDIIIDEEYKPLVQTKLLNEFTESYYNNFVLYTLPNMIDTLVMIDNKDIIIKTKNYANSICKFFCCS